MKGKLLSWTSLKLNLLLCERHRQPNEKSTHKWEKNFTKHIYYKILVFKIYKKLLKCKNMIYSRILFTPKKNEIMPFATTWMDPEIVILSEVSQTKTNIYYIIFMWNLDYILCSQNGEALYSQKKQDQELTVVQTMNSLLPNSD